MHAHARALVRTPLDEGSARRRDLYVTPYRMRQTSMFPAGFTPAIPASERLQTHALDGTSTIIALKVSLIPAN
jgi:hypothetical protein